MNPDSLNMLAHIISGQIGNCLAGGTVILLFAALCSHLLRRESSGARFAVWFGGLVAIGGIPLFAIAWSLKTARGLSATRGGAAAITLPSSWAVYLFIAWSAIAGVALVRIIAGFWQVCVLRRRATVLDIKALSPELQETLARFRSARKVDVRLSDHVQSPTAIGLLSPAIVLPKWLLEELSAAEAQQIFLHELAHLRRWDDWSNLLQKIVKALFFFHPAVWWMEKQVSLEREMACDEAVLAQTGNPHAYAQCLVLLAEKSFFRRSVMLAQAAVSRVGQTSLRVARILRVGPPHTTGMWKVIAPSVAAALIACLALLARMPKLIAFERTEPAVTRAQVAPMPAPAVLEASNTSSTISNASSKQLAKSSSRKMRTPVVTGSTQRAGMPIRADRANINAVAARLGLESSGQSVMMMQVTPVSGLVVVFVENQQNGSAMQTVWQIQMWNITVLRSNQNLAPQRSPRKI